MSFVIDCLDSENPFSKQMQEALAGCVQTNANLLIEVSFVSGEEIRSLNRELRGIDKVTDVLSFPSLDLKVGQAIFVEDYPFEIDEEGRLLLGSIAICLDRAKEQAEEYGHSFERELHYLFVHGVMHCLGHDHENEEEKALMRKEEEKVLEKLGITRSEEE